MANQRRIFRQLKFCLGIPKLIKEETSGFDPNDDSSSSMNARHHRADEYMQTLKGQIDVELAEQFLSDHVDQYERTTLDKKVDQPNERTLCGHVDNSPRGVKEWGWDAYNPGGAVQGKATDSAMTAKMSFVARAGHPCGADFFSPQIFSITIRNSPGRSRCSAT